MRIEGSFLRTIWARPTVRFEIWNLQTKLVINWKNTRFVPYKNLAWRTNYVFFIFITIDWVIFTILVNKWSLLFQKCTQVRDFDFFHFWVFIAFNSRDMTMLWVLNLCSRSSPTKLWKRIFDLRSQKIFFDTQSWQAVNFSHIDSVGNVKFESEISMKKFFSTKFFFVL